MTAEQSRWVLHLDDGRTISRAVARRAPLVAPELVEEALCTAPRNPPVNARVARSTPIVFGFDARGRIVVAYLPPNTAGLVGERASAVRWLSGCPRVEWSRIDVQKADR